MLFILLFWLTHPRYDFFSAPETSVASEPCPGSAWRRKTTQAAPWRQRYLCLSVPRRREGEEPFSASSREKSTVGHREVPPCLASPCRSSTFTLNCSRTASRNKHRNLRMNCTQKSNFLKWPFTLWPTWYQGLYFFIIIFFNLIFIYVVQCNESNH